MYAIEIVLTIIHVAVIIGCLIYIIVTRKKNLAMVLLSVLFLVMLLVRSGTGWFLTLQQRNLASWDTINNGVDTFVILVVISTLIMLAVTAFFLYKMAMKKKQSMNKQD